MKPVSVTNRSCAKALPGWRQSFRGERFIHPGFTAALIGNKLAWNQALSAIVPVPEIHPEPTASEPLFSNLVVGTYQPVQLIETGATTDPERYNTRFIDTRHSFRGHDYHDYYVSLRAMCVGTELISLLVRTRPVSEQDPSVHDQDTPLDGDLLNSLYFEIALPRQAAVETICSRLGQRLGLGFYAHDLLPERETGRTFVCESNLKFDEGTLRAHLAPSARLRRFII